jgi:hypothetical protein
MINPARGDDLIERGQEFDLSPEIIENSPVLRRWLREIPNIFEDIHNQPSFRTRVRFGYSQFPSNRHVGGINLGVEDIFIANTPLTVSGEYYTAIGGDRLSVGGDLHYYLLPKGSYINITPVLGYRYLETNGFNTDGVNVGARLVLSLSPGGAADIFVTQSFVSPGSNEEVGITTISAGYALTENIRLSTDIQWQNSIQKEDSRVGISLEWMP